MKKETYLKIFQKIQSVSNGVVLIKVLGKILTYATAFIYFAAIIENLLAQQWKRAALFILVPAVSFMAVSVFRKCYNARRPYERYHFTPLLAKDTKGKSFPSRHVFSIFVIGSTLAWVYPAVGILICLMGCVLAVIRVVVGVHFPKDVIAGALVGMVCGGMAGLFL